MTYQGVWILSGGYEEYYWRVICRNVNIKFWTDNFGMKLENGCKDANWGREAFIIIQEVNNKDLN